VFEENKEDKDLEKDVFVENENDEEELDKYP
jgi:hypothetical protein